ncbi:MAG: ribosomal protein S5-alanine N-acetyltransferase [Deltaproteobacteria bacterium]|nr:ribosomal protein S5-alanine N-acetyltransferase [Deltaproteobacteria bacterium]
MSEPLVLQTARCTLRQPTRDDAGAVAAFYVRNRDFHAPFEPRRPESYYEETYWQGQLEVNNREFVEGRSCRFFLFEKQCAKVIGTANFTGIMRLAMQACYLGYSLDQDYQGRGLMSEALKTMIDYAFSPTGMNLHRIMANHLPDNRRSETLLKKLGFEVEGYAREYLMIDGRWRDHVLTALTNRNWQPAQVD